MMIAADDLSRENVVTIRVGYSYTRAAVVFYDYGVNE